MGVADVLELLSEELELEVVDEVGVMMDELEDRLVVSEDEMLEEASKMLAEIVDASTLVEFEKQRLVVLVKTSNEVALAVVDVEAVGTFRLTVEVEPGATKKITVSAACADIDVDDPELVAVGEASLLEVRLAEEVVVSEVNEVSDAATDNEDSCRDEVDIVNGVVSGAPICSVAGREVPREKLGVAEAPSVGFVESPMVVPVDKGALAIEVEFSAVSSPVEPAAILVGSSKGSSI
ncbi:uncharacterized protein CCOS01_11079 [Colletotrichum costaricense]|uniref:Uncharacterized protein n=2 Tax=Colletotrichum acutatum species complex TaxID=2707335 RepID=A0AAJ0DX26_9PEZI|nr:uncharacterized protein CCOS01_11079 [Colletotrichum costaricense]XP_060372359.1 uncharacterized protein CTAM01_17071 [Colletotrichum tamarilloi]KAK1464371.1 hypothetical protein CTAM01_17071 [Colletotrichum tamarilloi]KAK1519428.1 hypothetical protein CCOS01_11079 [Colletotrichum costaricense]